MKNNNKEEYFKTKLLILLTLILIPGIIYSLSKNTESTIELSKNIFLDEEVITNKKIDKPLEENKKQGRLAQSKDKDRQVGTEMLISQQKLVQINGQSPVLLIISKLTHMSGVGDYWQVCTFRINWIDLW